MFEGYRKLRMAEMISAQSSFKSKDYLFFRNLINENYKRQYAGFVKNYKAYRFTKAKANQRNLAKYSLSKKQLQANKNAKYLLYYAWAEYYYKRKRYNDAYDKILIALKYKKTKKSLGLKKSISIVLENKRLNENFDKTIANIKSMITKNKHLRARDTIISYLSRTKNEQKRKKLNELLSSVDKKLRNMIYKNYEDGKRAFLSEDYETAIEKFTLVQKADDSYKEVDDYLKKAKEKKELLDSF